MSGSYARAMTISSRLTSIAAFVLLGGLTLSACGGNDASAGDSSDSTSSGGGKFGALTKANFSDVLTDSQLKAESAHVEMRIEMDGQSVEAKGDMRGSSPEDMAMTLTMDFESMTFRMCLLDQKLYMNMGEMTEDKFLKVDLTDESNPFAKQWAEMMDQMDPAKQMAELKDAVISFEQKGEAKTIDEVEAQRYVVEVDPSKIKAFKELPAAAARKIPDTIVYTMYVGPDDLLRRMEFDLGGVKTRVDFSQWGEPVDIEAPPADEISDKDFSDLADMSAPAA